VIRGYTCQPVYGDLYGRLSKAELLVETKKLVPGTHGLYNRNSSYYALETDVSASVRIDFDYSGDDQTLFDKDENKPPFIYMEVASEILGDKEPFYGLIVHGLVLLPCVGTNANVYERIGIFRASDNNVKGFGYQCVEGKWCEVEREREIIILV
jgi:hypothetical protein